jgi:glutathione S-transferase
MLLYSSATSPFGRKVKIAIAALDLTDRIQIIPADPWSADDIMRSINPLGKMPVLVTELGSSIFESGVILEYLDTLMPQPKLFPKLGNIEVRVIHALGNGLIEAGLAITYEKQRRPREYTYVPWVEHQMGKLVRGLQQASLSPPNAFSIDAGSIALACALGYFDWRKQINWRAEFPGLVNWLDDFRHHCPAFDATRSEH